MSIDTHRKKLSPKEALRGCWRASRALALMAIVPLILLYVFGFSAKTTSEYDCVIRTVGQSAPVVAVTGEPITPGLFAWTSYFESSGGLRQGQFYTTLSGPRGHGRIQTQFYRTPIHRAQPLDPRERVFDGVIQVCIGSPEFETQHFSQCEVMAVVRLRAVEATGKLPSALVQPCGVEQTHAKQV